MSDELQPLPTEGPSPPQALERNILKWMIALIAAGSIAGVVFANVAFGVGVLVGGAMSLANYFWQRRSTRGIFEGAVRGEMPVLPAVRYILRYVVTGAALWVIYMTALLPVVAVVLGLSAFAFAVVSEGLKSIFNSQGS